VASAVLGWCSSVKTRLDGTLCDATGNVLPPADAARVHTIAHVARLLYTVPHWLSSLRWQRLSLQAGSPSPLADARLALNALQEAKEATDGLVQAFGANLQRALRRAEPHGGDARAAPAAVSGGAGDVASAALPPGPLGSFLASARRLVDSRQLLKSRLPAPLIAPPRPRHPPASAVDTPPASSPAPAPSMSNRLALLDAVYDVSAARWGGGGGRLSTHRPHRTCPPTHPIPSHRRLTVWMQR